MSTTPNTDALRKIQHEGLNPEALNQLCEWVLGDLLKETYPEHFDEDGEPNRYRSITIATS